MNAAYNLREIDSLEFLYFGEILYAIFCQTVCSPALVKPIIWYGVV